MLISHSKFCLNVVVLALEMKHTNRVKKRLHHDGSVFIMNLSIADILMGIFHFPFVVVSSFKGKWIFGQIGYYYINYFLH